MFLPAMAHRHSPDANSSYKAHIWAQTANRMLAARYSREDAIEHANSAINGMNAMTGDVPMRDVFVVRHGATALNNDDVSVDRIRGWKDIPLSDEGRQEAEHLAGDLITKHIDIIVASDLERARETADIISRITGVPVREVSKEFRPWNVGEYAGQLTSTSIPILIDYATNMPDNPLPGGESFNEFKARFLSGVSRVLSEYSGRVAVVTHHRGERLMEAWIAAGQPPDASIDCNVFCQKGEAPGEVTELEVNPVQLRMAASAKSIEVEKMSKAQADYTDNGTADRHCGICSYYENLKCHMVMGPIKPEGWCKYFENRKYGSAT